MARLVTAKGTARRSAVRCCCTALALFLAFVCAPAAQTGSQAGPIGLLAMPEFFSSEYCDGPTLVQRRLYAVPGPGDIVGWIRAGKNPATSDAECSRVVLNVHRPDDVNVSELPTEEYEEEEPTAAVVVEAQGRWFKLRLNEGAAWIEMSPQDRYFPLEALLQRRPAYLTEVWDHTLADTPGEATRRVPRDPRRRLIGYVEPVLQAVRMTIAPGQDLDEIRRRYHTTYISSQDGPGGTSILHFESGTHVPAFERPEPGAPVLASFQTDICTDTLRGVSNNPPRVAVFGRSPGWLQVALRGSEWRSEPRAWIEDGPAWRFHAFASAAEREEFERDAFGRENLSVRLAGSRVVGEALWLRVELLSHGEDDPRDPPTVVATGWVPAHDRAGESVVWFYSRD